MIKKVFAIRDSKAGMYNQPFHMNLVGEAERALHRLVNDDKSTISQYPEDFDLFEIGEFDDQSGLYQCLDTPRHILKAAQLVGKQPSKNTTPSSVQ